MARTNLDLRTHHTAHPSLLHFGRDCRLYILPRTFARFAASPKIRCADHHDDDENSKCILKRLVLVWHRLPPPCCALGLANGPLATQLHKEVLRRSTASQRRTTAHGLIYDIATRSQMRESPRSSADSRNAHRFEWGRAPHLATGQSVTLRRYEMEW